MRRWIMALAALLTVVGCGDPASVTTAESPTTGGTASTISSSSSRPETTEPAAAGPGEDSSACDGDAVFDYPPVDLEAIEYMVPFGLMIDSHVTPVDHHYFQDFAEPDRLIDVFSPGAGRVNSIQHFGTPVNEDPQGIVDDFRLVIDHTCSVSSIFIHIDELEPSLAALDPGVGNYASIDVPVEAGELIGRFTQNVDFNLVDLDYTTDGLIDPSSYEREPWKIHVPYTLDYFTPEIGSRMESLSLRSAEPRIGRFTYDIDGRLVGNWFEKGTNGYGGVDEQRYWAGHLAFAYNYIDPTMVEVSIGTFNRRSGQFAVVGNGPDPADVSVDDGVVVYELVDWDYYVDGEHWDRVRLASGIQAVPGDQVRGTIAVQLLEDRKLQVEVSPEATAEDFTGFGPEALLYTR